LNNGVRWYLDNTNIQVFLSFTVKITTSHLNKIRYSPYQQELWEIIREKHNSGMGYRLIANWLNKHKYKTLRGHKFKNSHVYSILKKKRIANERMENKSEFVIQDLGLIFKKILNL
tara:strand:- start:504 stop:851 length:348 start_codon:yes stop_codon:yes gene_type:complete